METIDQSWLVQTYNIYFGDLGVKDFIVPLGFILWSLMLTISIKAFDCTHVATALSYMLFSVFSGVIQVIAFPSLFKIELSYFADISLIVVFAGLAGFKWFRQHMKSEVRFTPHVEEEV